MTDIQWNDIRGSLKPVNLPKQARERIDQCVGFYRFMQTWDGADRGSPELLRRTAGSARELISLLDRIGERECFAVACSVLLDAELEGWSTESREAHVMALVGATRNQLTVIADYCGDGADVDFSKRKNHTGNIDRLLIGLDHILKQFAGLRVSRSKAVMTFVFAVLALASGDERAGAGSAERAIVRLQRNGTFPTQKSSKVTAQKTR